MAPSLRVLAFGRLKVSDQCSFQIFEQRIYKDKIDSANTIFWQLGKEGLHRITKDTRRAAKWPVPSMKHLHIARILSTYYGGEVFWCCD